MANALYKQLNFVKTHYLTKRNFPRFAWGLLLYTLFVIMWGAFVRASFSGDGCGANWPACGGEIIPNLNRTPKIIEFMHRISTTPLAPLLLLLVFWSRSIFPKGHQVRSFAVITFLFTLMEGLVGAVQVKLGATAHSESILRAVIGSVHLTTTFFLLSSLTLTAWIGSGEKQIRFKNQGVIGLAIFIAFAGSLILGVSGVITALGDMLHPSATLAEGIRQDFLPGASFLVRLRPLHPLIAMSVGLYSLLIAGLLSHLRPSPNTERFAKRMGALFIIQIFAGALNLLMKAPIPMQLLHLLLGDLVWLNLVLLSASAMAEGVPVIEDHRFGLEIEEGLEVAGWKDYLALTKPRVISLLLFTTLAAMFIAQKGVPNLLLFLAVGIGGYMAAGAANAINMVIDRDIDGRMKRTSTRPTVTRKITSSNALWFAFWLASGSFALLWLSANLLTAMLALAGLVFYVVIYTMLLKRRTWHNIVIGGAAGAFPPLVGWAAITNNLSALAWVLFAIIFVWTPVHFWALAILLKDDYASVGIPMLPVVRGDRVTVIQIIGYTVLTALISITPFFIHELALGKIYFVASVVLNAILFVYALQLFQKIERPRASKLFHYSMLYLALLFLMMAIDRSVHL